MTDRSTPPPPALPPPASGGGSLPASKVGRSPAFYILLGAAALLLPLFAMAGGLAYYVNLKSDVILENMKAVQAAEAAAAAREQQRREAREAHLIGEFRAACDRQDLAGAEAALQRLSEGEFDSEKVAACRQAFEQAQAAAKAASPAPCPATAPVDSLPAP